MQWGYSSYLLKKAGGTQVKNAWRAGLLVVYFPYQSFSPWTPLVPCKNCHENADASNRDSLVVRGSGGQRQWVKTTALVILNALQSSTVTMEANIAKTELFVLEKKFFLAEFGWSRVTYAVWKWLSGQKFIATRRSPLIIRRRPLHRWGQRLLNHHKAAATVDQMYPAPYRPVTTACEAHR